MEVVLRLRCGRHHCPRDVYRDDKCRCPGAALYFRALVVEHLFLSILTVVLFQSIYSDFHSFLYLVRQRAALIDTMRSTFAVALGGAVGLASAYPQPQRRAVASFPAGQSWDIVLNSADVNLNDLASTEAASATAIDIDLFDNEASTISTLKSQNKQVICYFSAGSREDWRDDAGKFSSSDYGQELDGWAGENWVNVKSDNVRSIMKERIKLAATKGCTAVDPDNVDGFVSTLRIYHSRGPWLRSPGQRPRWFWLRQERLRRLCQVPCFGGCLQWARHGPQKRLGSHPRRYRRHPVRSKRAVPRVQRM